MKKILIVLLVLVLLAGGALWYFMTYRMDDFIAQQIEKIGTETLATQVTVGEVVTDLGGGSLTISDITVANPAGFSNPNAFTLRGIEAVVNYQTLEIRRIIVDKPEIVIEERDGATNFTALLAGMERGSDTPEPAEDSAPPPVLTIDLFRMNESRAAFESTTLDRASNITVDEVELTGLRGTPPEVAEAIVREILDEVVAAAALELLKTKATEKLEKIFN
ncbi:MAG: hypothetical protein PVI83_04790 [Lysobacterales bacterium]|jgi:hypothetical protein